MSIRVLLVDDDALVRAGLSMVLGGLPDITVVGEVANGAEVAAAVRRLRPDVVLMDIRMPRLDGIQATRLITAQAPAARVILLTTFDIDEYAIEGVQAGASGFLIKNTGPEELLAGIRAVAAGDAVLAPSTTRRLLDTYSHLHAPGCRGGSGPASRPIGRADPPRTRGVLRHRQGHEQPGDRS